MSKYPCSHTLASTFVDCVLLGPKAVLKMNQSSPTGEKLPGDDILNGTNATEGSGKMIGIVVGIHGVTGRIKARVYDGEDQ